MSYRNNIHLFGWGMGGGGGGGGGGRGECNEFGDK